MMMSESSSSSCSRRQRLLNMMRTTKDVYIPAVQNSLSQAKLSLKNYYNSYEESGETLPFDRSIMEVSDRELQLICYPSYTRIGTDKSYVTEVRGMVYTNGKMNRRNRLIFSICKQLIKPTASPDIEKELESVLVDDSIGSKDTLCSSATVNSSDSSSVSSSFSAGSNSTATSQHFQEEILRERLAGFLNKTIPRMPIIVDLVDRDGNQETEFTSTDEYGLFQIHTNTSFLPRMIRVTVDVSTPISTRYDTNLIEDSGIAVISDIDDTIKHTGVVGDKRSVFCNVFVNSFSTWLIRGMSLWYNTLKDSENVDFFYVSNSPYQIYPTLRQYISNEYPMGPIFLKQYAGNLLCSLISSSAKLKIPSIAQICSDFPNKKFILVGDSGEEDLEAYVATARNFPSQIIGIYIRSCKESMSDDPAKDWAVMDELNSIISEKYLSVIRRNTSGKNKKKISPPIPPKKIRITKEQEEDIKKSKLLCSNTRLDKIHSPKTASPLIHSINETKGQPPCAVNIPPQVPPRHCSRQSLSQSPTETTKSAIALQQQDDYALYSLSLDNKAEEWKIRLIKAINTLLDSGVEARFMFFKDADICIEDSISKIRSIKE
ncbi:HFL306Wp [Eremothecium sinecaudum]|uniref:HFL306Wp n=1 Tax=Eremothecium sinecaudum TaxID=45286 RepID=A0A0X8HU62_9SACH|nr:HFL306Wp [Eremothecium sinecaudum]AMD21550.1 HFL306Wp [Eremothecium sinecaudum]